MVNTGTDLFRMCQLSVWIFGHGNLAGSHAKSLHTCGWLMQWAQESNLHCRWCQILRILVLPERRRALDTTKRNRENDRECKQGSERARESERERGA